MRTFIRNIKRGKTTAIILIISVFIAIIATFFVPSKEGLCLLRAVWDVRSIDPSLSLAPGVDITLSPVRYSLASAINMRLKMGAAEKRGWIESGNPTLRAIWDSMLPGAVQSISPVAGLPCDIVVSADAFSSGRPSLDLLSIMVPDHRLAWRYMILHEWAHCNWNAALKMEAYLAANKVENLYQAPTFKLAQAFGESYADVFALTVLKRFQGAIDFEKIAKWRYASSTPGMVHRTSASLLEAASASRNIDIRSFDTYDRIHRFSTVMALRGILNWRREVSLANDVSDSQIVESLYPATGIHWEDFSSKLN